MNNIQKNFKAKSALRKGHGGSVKGPGGPTDDKVGPVMLSDDEYVLPADTTAAIGVNNLDEIRDATHDYEGRMGRPLSGLPQAEPSGLRRQYGSMQRMADGGLVRPEDEKRPGEMGIKETFQQGQMSNMARMGSAVGTQLVKNYLDSQTPEHLRPKPMDASKAPLNPNSVMGQARAADIAAGVKPAPTLAEMVADGRAGPANGSASSFGPKAPAPSVTSAASGLRTPSPSAPPTVVPPTNPIATAPGGNTLPATQNSGAPMRTGTAPHVERDMGRAQVVNDGKPRLPAPAAAAADSVKPQSWLRANSGKLLGVAAGVGLGAKNMYDVSQDPESDWKDVLNQGGHELAGIGGGIAGGALGGALGSFIPGPGTIAGGVAGGVAGYMGGQELANQADSLLGGDGMSPLAAIEKRREAAANPPVGVMAPKDPNTLSDFAGRITKDALSRPGGSALRSQGGSMLAPTPSGIAPNTVPSTSIAPDKGYQTEQLTKLGVSPKAQNGPSLPQGATTLQSYGTKDYQNLGTYGGDANLYGRASDPARPGRINDFVGVGAKATAESALRGNTIPSDDWQVRRGRELLAQDKARAAGGRDPNKLYIGTADGELGSTEQRFGAMRRELQQKFGSAGDKYLLGKHMQKLEESQAAAMAADAETAQKADEAALLADTNRYTSDNQRDSYKYTSDTNLKIAELEAEATRGSALRTAAKDARTVRNTNEKNLTAAIDDTVKVLSEGDATKAAQLTNMLTTLPPKMKEKLQNMAPIDQRAIMQAIASVHGAGMNMDAERDTGGMVQNGAIVGGLAGAGSLVANKFTKPGTAAKVGDLIDGTAMILSRGKYQGHVARGVAQGASLGVPTLAAAGGAYFTPKNQPTNRPSPLQYNADGTPKVQGFNWTDAMNNGIFDTLWDTNFRRVDGQLINKAGLTADQVDAYRMIFEAN